MFHEFVFKNRDIALFVDFLLEPSYMPSRSNLVYAIIEVVFNNKKIIGSIKFDFNRPNKNQGSSDLCTSIKIQIYKKKSVPSMCAILNRMCTQF